MAQLSVVTHVSAAAYTKGDVMVSTCVGDGNVYEYTPDGTLVQKLTTDFTHSCATGSGFDGSGNFYVTGFGDDKIDKFDTNGNFVGDFGSGYNCDDESISFNKAGDAFVGQAGCTTQLLEFSPSGSPINAFSPTTENRGTDWNDPATDQCVIRYTSEGADVLQYNICTSTQLANFNTAPLPGSSAYEFRQLPDGEVLVADATEVVRLSATGAQVQTYSIPGSTGRLFGLNLDPDGTSFWTADISSGGVVAKVDIATGHILKSWHVAQNLAPAGLAVVGQITSGGPPPNVPEVPA